MLIVISFGVGYFIVRPLGTWNLEDLVSCLCSACLGVLVALVQDQQTRKAFLNAVKVCASNHHI